MEKVSLVSCKDYDYEKVKIALERNIKQIGGLEPFISKDDVVLLKVNLLMKKKPEEATTTHPVYVRALSQILNDYGVKVIIGDSPGGPFTKGVLESLYKYTGYEEAAQLSGATLNYNVDSFTKKDENNLYLKSIVMTDMLNDVTKVISVSKLKTHGMMTFTGGVKNMFGTVPGVKKAEYHFNMKTHDDFADCLIDICNCANPVLSFMDGIVGMEGEGPSGGTPREIGVSLLSTSPYHLDKVACSIINLDFDKVPTIRRSVARNIVTNDLSDLELIGEGFKSFYIDNYEIPETQLLGYSGRVPKFLESFLNKHIQPKPVFNYSTCVGCRVCEQSCPAKVITMVDNKPVVDLDGCIRCFCCQELCPKVAVTVKRPMLLKLFIKE